MIVDYKIVEEREDSTGLIYQKVRFYEGDITTEDEAVSNEIGEPATIQPVTRYRRTALIEEREYYYDN